MLELSIKTESQSEFTLIASFALVWALALCAGMAWHLWRTFASESTDRSASAAEKSASKSMYRAVRLIGYESVLILLTCVHIGLWLVVLQSGERDRLSIPLLSAGVIVSVVVWRWLCDEGSQWRIGKRFGALGLSGIQVVGLAALMNIYSGPTPDTTDPHLVPGEVVAKAEWFAVTDQGNQLGLYERRLPQEKFAEFIDRIRPQIASLSQHAIRRNSAVMVANCHGWVFARGEHLVRNEDVEQILNENGYVMQPVPKVGDVVVYRNANGQILHTGVVCGLIEEDTALVQSKWGVEGCFVHLAEQQPYSQDFTFWRSDRSTNCLNIFYRDENGTVTPVHTVENQNVGIDD